MYLFSNIIETCSRTIVQEHTTSNNEIQIQIEKVKTLISIRFSCYFLFF